MEMYIVERTQQGRVETTERGAAVNTQPLLCTKAALRFVCTQIRRAVWTDCYIGEINCDDVVGRV